MMLRIREVREQLGISQKDFAKSLGIKPTTYNGYETGMHDPKSDILVHIAKMYNVSIDYLLGISDVMFLKDTLPSNVNIQAVHPLLTIYESLNEDGQEELMNYAKYVASSPKYKKCSDLSEADGVG